MKFKVLVEKMSRTSPKHPIYVCDTKIGILPY